MEFVLGTLSTLPRMAMVPFKWQFQPVDAGEVAARLVDVVAGPPAGRLPDFGGPEVRDFKSLAEAWLKARRMNKTLVNLRLPFEASRLVSEGRLTCPDHKDGTMTFEQYLDRRYPQQP
jgi:uncharacterized protein YbjT (DUF2867 family)